MNAIDSASEAVLARIWDAIDRNPEIRCVVLTGAGRAFCAGADMKEDGPEGIAYWVGTRRSRIRRHRDGAAACRSPSSPG